MASVIEERTISAVVDKRIQHVNSNWARPWPLSIGTSWTKLRVGVRVIMDNTGANLVSTPRFAMGVCSGSTNLLFDATTTHFLGWQQSAATMTFAAGPPIRYSFDTAGLKRVGSTSTFTATMAVGFILCADPTTANRAMFFCDITKGSPNYTLDSFGRTGTAAGDVTLADFLATVPLAVPAFANHGASASRTIAVDEGVDGTFDHMLVGWDRTTPVLEICDIAVVRLS